MTTATASSKRRYDNTLRRERANATRERIVTAGAALVRHSSPSDWRGVTIRAVADRASVNERTVYRHFANERALRDAVMQRLEQAVGIDLEALELDDIAGAAERMFRHLAGYPIKRRPLDPTLAEANARQHEALLAAVAAETPRWSGDDRTLAAAMLDVLWSLASYERLVRDWDLNSEEAIRGTTWVIDLLARAVRDRQRPPKREA